jgi:hypothetical protein
VNFGLLLPAGLAALGALLLPLLIHLARRSERRPTVFAALRWLQQKAKPRHRLRFDEWPLLLVRLLLLALLALLLARPVLFGSADTLPRVAVVPGVDLQQARAQTVPSDARWQWLAPGFPALSGTPPVVEGASSAASITSLLRELDASLAPEAQLTVLVPERLDGVDAQRPVLSRRIDWRVLPGAMPDAPVAEQDTAPSLSVRYASDREPSVRFLRAADLAWREPPAAAHTPDIAPLSQPLDAHSRHLAWLAPGPLPSHVADWIRAGGTALVDAEAALDGAPTMVALWRDDTGAVLVEGTAYGRGRLLRFTRALVPQEFPSLLDPVFPQHLRRVLASSSPPAPARVRAADFEPDAGGPVFATAPRELQSWLLVLVVLTFLVERWLATGARQRVAP